MPTGFIGPVSFIHHLALRCTSSMIFSNQKSSTFQIHWSGIIRQSHMGCKELSSTIAMRKAHYVVLCVLLYSLCPIRGDLRNPGHHLLLRVHLYGDLRRAPPVENLGHQTCRLPTRLVIVRPIAGEASLLHPEGGIEHGGDRPLGSGLQNQAWNRERPFPSWTAGRAAPECTPER